MRFILAIILCLFVAPAFANTTAIVVGDDPGGSLADNAKWLNRIEEANIPVEVNGTCVSACTMVLHLKNLCVSRWSKFGFHLPYDAITKTANRAFSVTLANDVYPKPLADWYIKNIIEAMDKQVADHKDDKDYHPDNQVRWLSAQELVDMGVVKMCQ